MRLALLLAIAVISLAAGGCTSNRVDTVGIQQRTHQQVVASKPRHSTAVMSPADCDDLQRDIRRAKIELYRLSLADPADPAVAAALEIAAVRYGVLRGAAEASGLFNPSDLLP